MHFHPDRGHDHRLPSEITPRSVFEGRRDLLRLIGSGVAGTALAGWAQRDARAQAASPGARPRARRRCRWPSCAAAA